LNRIEEVRAEFAAYDKGRNTQARQDSLARRMVHAYGYETAAATLEGRDPEANDDIAAWMRLGR
jgi:hypothetical protein